jgi:hypothetical protein
METIETAVATVERSGAMSLKQVTDRVNLVHQVLEKVMRKDTHYGTVPGCGNKMVLLKPGADVLAMTFRLVPQFKVERSDMADGHREFDVTCSMFGPAGELLGQGVGSASTMEKKYRYRKDSNGNKIENEDIADVYNTVLKIAKKRAHIDATLTVTGAADLFTQDLIDEDEPERKPPAMPTAKKDAAPEPPKAQAQPQPTAEPLTVRGEVEASGIKTGQRNGKEWHKLGVKVAGEWYSTFDTKIEPPAKGDSVEITYTPDGEFKKLVSWCFIAEGAPADREPGSEG